MGRRALPRVNADADLSGHYVEARNLAEPFDQQQLFGRVAPLQIEVGSGKGLFLASAAPATPEHDFLGIEIARKYAKFAASRLAKSLGHGDVFGQVEIVQSFGPRYACNANVAEVWQPGNDCHWLVLANVCCEGVLVGSVEIERFQVIQAMCCHNLGSRAGSRVRELYAVVAAFGQQAGMRAPILPAPRTSTSFMNYPLQRIAR